MSSLHRTRPPLWSAAELREALAPVEGEAVDVDGISIDSRTLSPGDLFVALSGGPDPRYRGAGGSGRDGHAFVVDAARAGAAAALVSRPVGDALAELRVADVFDALWRLARAGRDRCRAPVFAITGSSGKTTAKGMLAAALEAIRGDCHAAEGSLNNHIGVPLSLARMPADAASAVFEIGMNSPGEIEPLARLVRPDVALVLNVLPVHLEGLGSIEAIRTEKLSIARGLGPEGILVVHEAVSLTGVDAPRVLRFGGSPRADVRLEDAGEGVRILLPDGRVLDAAHLAESPHRRLTACAVVAMLHAAGLDPAAGLAAIAATAPPPGRGGIRDCGGVALIDDAYNANPESVRLALEGLRERSTGRRWALLGDMLELGPDELDAHAGLAPACAGLDGVFCVGERTRALHAALPESLRAGWWPDCEALELERVVSRLARGRPAGEGLQSVVLEARDRGRSLRVPGFVTDPAAVSYCGTLKESQ
ncbi:MAG: UDP-N-acetylmuramoyl-tripeptide--D-alanyl-D-alanine ligase [Gammaproteobacteria bacterium]|nr:UDP-N-acetylmuramoyl-tripeptide--D-alanyl-D-alanine ligase [Gammaproteobacteria bacterium]